MGATLIISSPSKSKLNAIADIFVDAFEGAPNQQLKKLKLVVGNAPKMGIGIKPVTRIELNFENYTEEMFRDIQPLLRVMAISLQKQMDDDFNVELVLSDGVIRKVYSSKDSE